uniref:ATP-dependent RNA helicase n=1 Tax=Pseudo-nitzschia australis TaxID=44445 RepID=A0A7S4AWL8_9STRA
MTDSLDDLNIVAVPSASAAPQFGAKKKKKNNKYERRRQKAKKAKEQKKINRDNNNTDGGEVDVDGQQTTPSMDQDALLVLQNSKTNPDDDDKSRSITHRSDEQTIIASNKKDLKSTSAISPDSHHASSKKQSTTETINDNDSSSKKSLSKRKDGSFLGKDDSNPVSRTSSISSNFESATNILSSSSSSSPLQPSNPKKAGASQIDDDEERAKYMAEFHARPMELDRRSGARSATIVSTESAHLFTTDAQNNSWESLNIYPRLLQTLRSAAFDSLKKPTTIQLRTIRAFQESTNALLRESKDKDSSNSSKNKKKNVLIHSETGSGKTLAYLIPIIQSMAFGNKFDITTKNEKPTKISRSEMGCRCIILCPTRELACQTLQVLERLCQANFAGWIVPGGLLGGDSRKSEKASLRKGLAIIVATPGRLLDHLHKTQSLALSLKGRLKWLVLDEADRLLDMGLGDQVRQIVQWIWANEACSSHQQPWWRSVLVSATVTPSVQALAKERILCGDQEWIWVKGESEAEKLKKLSQKRSEETNEDFAASTPRQLAQFHITVTAKLRLSALIAFLVQRVSKGERTVVFIGTCASVDFHYELFNALEESLWDDDSNAKKDQEDAEDVTETAMGLFGRKARVFKLHGSVSHSKRSQTMKEFNANISTDPKKSKSRADILLTTDVSARGLNLKGVDWTVQYDPPCEISDYVHRVGRVARAGKAGHSLLFLLPSERKYLDVLKTKGIAKLTPISLSSILNQAAGTCKEFTQEGSRQQGGESGSGTTKNSRQSGHSRSSRSGEHFAAEVQRRLEDCVVRDDAATRKAYKASTSKRQQKERKRKLVNSSKDGRKEGVLLEKARDAFMSFLRAYSTKKESIVRSIFSSRALHFGHIAKSFALKEPPKSLVSKQKTKREQQEGQLKDEEANLPRSLQFGKSLAGLDALLGGDMDDINNQKDTYSNDDEDTNYKSKKRRKLQQKGKFISAKTLLLENATKMQNNLMDAM